MRRWGTCPACRGIGQVLVPLTSAELATRDATWSKLPAKFRPTRRDHLVSCRTCERTGFVSVEYGRPSMPLAEVEGMAAEIGYRLRFVTDEVARLRAIGKITAMQTRAL
jgi:hypothetical protein